MSDADWRFVTVTPDDPLGINTTIVNFSNYLPPAGLLFEPGATVQVALFSFSYDLSAAEKAATYFINASVVAQTMIVGSQETNAMARMTLDNAQATYFPQILQWVPAIHNGGPLTFIDVQVTNVDGSDPSGAFGTDETSIFITFAFRTIQ
jgi:hypothetical protein